MKLGSQVVSAGLFVTVRLLYLSLSLPYSQPSLPVFLPPQLRAPQPSRHCVQFHFPVALQLSILAINRHSSLLRHANIAANVHIWSQVSCCIPRDSLHLWHSWRYDRIGFVARRFTQGSSPGYFPYLQRSIR